MISLGALLGLSIPGMLFSVTLPTLIRSLFWVKPAIAFDPYIPLSLFVVGEFYDPGLARILFLIKCGECFFPAGVALLFSFLEGRYHFWRESTTNKLLLCFFPACVALLFPSVKEEYGI